MEAIFTLDHLITFLSLSGLEIILGIDNVIFIAIITSSIPAYRRNKVRIFGISLAIALRIFMLTGASWVMTLHNVLFSLGNFNFTGRSILLLAGGVFLLVKSVHELYIMLGFGRDNNSSKVAVRYTSDMNVIYQIIFVDLVLSFDSVIVAVGMVNKLYLIIPAILVAMAAMLMSAQVIGEFISSNPSIKVLGLGFVLLIGVALSLDGIGIHVPKGYLYSAMFFSLFVELMNVRVRRIRS